VPFTRTDHGASLYDGRPHRKRVVLYLRLSAVADDSTSITRQEADLQALAEREGWVVVATLTDEGISGRKARANAAEALRMLREDEADVLAVWKLDRWTRQGLGAIGALSDTLDAVPGSLFVALQDGLRSDQSSWRLIAAVLSEVARSEADNTSARIRSSIAHRKTVADRFAGAGGTIPFGYDSAPAPDGVGRVLVVNPVEAAVVRDVAGRILDDEVSLWAVARDLNADGVPTSKSDFRKARYRGTPDPAADRGRWTVTVVRSLWTSHSILGRVMHRGDLVRDEDGLPRSVWPPLLDLVTVERLRERVGYRSTPAEPRRKAARLLSGVAFCAYCDRKLYVTGSNGQAVYKCGASWNGYTCEAPSVNAELLDTYVSEHFLASRGEDDEVELVTTGASTGTDEALAEIEATLRETTAARLDDTADTGALVQRLSSLKARRAELRAIPATVSAAYLPTGRTLRESWHSADSLIVRRRILTTALDHLTISKAVRGRKGLDAGRITFNWNEGAGDDV
jgi:DNA invertase Pin-like site-specific DNA recombinase